jgi:hypothetical protein
LQKSSRTHTKPEAIHTHALVERQVRGERYPNNKITCKTSWTEAQRHHGQRRRGARQSVTVCGR